MMDHVGMCMQFHFNQFGAEGPTVPIDEICDLGFTHVKEFDTTQGERGKAFPPIGSPISPKLATCFPILNEFKFAYNAVCST